uniref:Uncharacterized protein n=1 Tax=Lygus hesperus TaxID=30085 RepID=A0A0K8TFL4_LYGHE
MSAPSNLSAREAIALAQFANLQKKASEHVRQYVTNTAKDVLKDLAGEAQEKLFEVIEEAIGFSADASLLGAFANAQHVGPMILEELAKGCSYAYVAGDVALLSHTLVLVILKCIAPHNGVSTLVLGTVISKIVRCMLNKQKRKLNVEGPSDEDVEGVVEMLTALWQMIAVSKNVAGSAPKSLTDLANSVFDGIGTVSNKTRSLILFFQNLCKCVYKLYSMFCDKVLGIPIGNTLLYRDQAALQTWAREAITLVAPDNEYKILHDTAWFARLFAAVKIGDYMAVELTRAGCKDTPPMFISLRKQLQEAYQRALNLGLATSFRPESIGLYCYGDPGLGKTRDKDDIIDHLFQILNVETTGDDIFPLTEGMKHWTGACGKKALYVDDFMAIETATSGETLTLLMHALTDARLTPPQAECDDKGKSFAPVLILLNSNQKMPRPTSVHTIDAFYRRRHICWEVAITPQFAEAGFRNLDRPEAIAWVRANATAENSRPHCQYRFFDTYSGDPKGPFMPYEMFIERASEMAQDRYANNVAEYNRKVARAQRRCDPNCGEPLAVMLARVQKSLEELSGREDAEEARSIWDLPLAHAKEASTYVSSWINGILGGKMNTEAGVKCQCSRMKYANILVNDSGEATWCTGELRGEKVEMRKCGDTCRVGSCWYIEETVQMLYDRGNFAGARWVNKNAPRNVPIYAEQESSEPEQLVDDLVRGSRVTELSWAPAFKMAGIGLACLVGAFGAWSVFKWLLGDKSGEESTTLDNREIYKRVIPESKVRSELLSSGDNMTTKPSSTLGIARKYVAQTTIPENPKLEVESYDQFYHIVDKHICYLILSGRDRSSGKEFAGFVMRAFGVCGRWIVLLAHYLAKINRTVERTVRYVSSDGTVDIFIDMAQLPTRSLDNSEVCFLELPKKVPMFSDIRCHFMREAETPKVVNSAVVYEKMLGAPARCDNIYFKIEKEVSYYDGDVNFVAPVAITYAWQSPGRCMTPILGKVGGVCKIIAFHFCGGSGRGAGEPVVRETFDCLGTQLNVQSPPPQYIDPERSSRICLEGDFVPLGVVKGAVAVRPAERTSIVPTEIHGYVPAKTRPAPLTPSDVGGKFSPLVSGCNKHGHPPKGFDPLLLERAVNHLREQYLHNCKPVRPIVEVLSDEDVVLGLPGVPGYHAMEMATSEGFPFTASRPQGSSNKRWLFNINENAEKRSLIAMDPLLVKVLESKRVQRDRGLIPCTVFVDCLKDSRIANESYLTPGKTRIFSISPVDFTIEFRKYFLDILAAQQQSRFHLEHMVGMNVHSLEWTLLARRIQSVGSAVICGDYSNFGPGLDSEVVAAVGDVWADWYEFYETAQGVSEEERKRRRQVRTIMFEEMRHSVHLCKDVLYRVVCGSPSGAPPTVNINNDVNKLYIYMAWLEATRNKPLYNSFVSFKKHIVLYVYGDDLIMNVSDEIKDWFNNEFLQSFFQAHGIRYTDELKGDTIRKYGTFAEASFLKGSFFPHPQRPSLYTYKLSTKSVEDCANWCHQGPDMIAASQQAIYDSLMLAYGAGKDYFDMHRARLLQAWSEKGLRDLVLYTYEEMDELRFGFNMDVVNESIDDLISKEKVFREQNKAAVLTAAPLTPLMNAEAFDPSYPRVSREAVVRMIKLAKRIQKGGGQVDKAIQKLYYLLDNGSE